MKEKVDRISTRKSPILNQEIDNYLTNNQLNLTATTNNNEAFIDVDYIIFATSTNYDPEKNYFNTSSVESVIRKVFLLIRKQ